VPQRSKEEAHDYRYFPEPDLPPLVVDDVWVEQVRSSLPELPAAKLRRFREQYGLNSYDAELLVSERAVADYFEEVAALAGVAPKTAANWITGELFALLNQAGEGVEAGRVSAAGLAGLLAMIQRNEINHNTAKTVLAEMYQSGRSAVEIVAERGLRQISDAEAIAALVERVLAENPEQVSSYLAGKESLSRWLFGQVMRAAQGKANPQVVQAELDRQLADLRRDS
jgi:aspartyl-tRNA(Asn)/glutamyl-tRNA(Gln) amidotransferase subunit B